jgi:diaminopimelate epimerase
MNTMFNGSKIKIIDKNKNADLYDESSDVTIVYDYGEGIIDCKFYNNIGQEIKLCGNALFAMMNLYQGIKEFSFLTKAGMVGGKRFNGELSIYMPSCDMRSINGFTDYEKHWRVNLGDNHVVVFEPTTVERYTLLKYYHSTHNIHFVYPEWNSSKYYIRSFREDAIEVQSSSSGAYVVGQVIMLQYKLDTVHIKMNGGEYKVDSKSVSTHV